MSNRIIRINTYINMKGNNVCISHHILFLFLLFYHFQNVLQRIHDEVHHTFYMNHSLFHPKYLRSNLHYFLIQNSRFFIFSIFHHSLNRITFMRNINFSIHFIFYIHKNYRKRVIHIILSTLSSFTIFTYYSNTISILTFLLLLSLLIIII